MQDATRHRVGGIDDDHGAEWILWRPGVWTAARSLAEAILAPTAPDSEAIHVWGDHGRWIVKCPDCNGAQLAAPNDHRFMCNECANITIDGLWRPVIWPQNHRELGAILAERVHGSDQNYDPGETAAQLREQNRILDAAKVIDGLRILPVVETDGDKGAVASEHEGHEHRWPKRIQPAELYECKGCGLTLLGGSITNARDEARTPAEQAQDERVRREKGERS